MWRAGRISPPQDAVLSPEPALLSEDSTFRDTDSGENLWTKTTLASDLNLRRLRHNQYLSRNCAVVMISSMPKKVTLGELFPDQSEEQIERIAEFLHGYCAVVWRIYERLEHEHPEVIDGLMKVSSMKGKVDSSTNTN